jgi:rfaE bifunctional protein kinase chain/domain
MKKLSLQDIEQFQEPIRKKLAEMEGQKVLVVGDIGLDEYFFGDVKRISPEAPVPVLEVKKTEYRVGLAANVAQNIHSLGGVALMVGVTGGDSAAQGLSDLLKKSGVSPDHFIMDRTRPTTRKTRVISGHHHIVRVDFEDRRFLAAEIEQKLLEKVSEQIKSTCGLILQDYGKGVLSEKLCQSLIRMAHDNGKKVVVDPHRTTPIRFYKGADLIKPNRDEAFILSGLNIDELHEKPDSVLEVGMALQGLTQAENIIITTGKDGVYFFHGEEKTQIPTIPRQVFDVTGAGDTYLAAFCLSWFSGVSPIQSAVMANYAAGVVVGKVGSVPCTKAELLEAMNN